MLADYFRLMNLNGAAHVYREALDTGVLDRLRECPATLDALAASMQLQPRPLALMLDVLVVLGLVAHEGEQFSATPLTQALIGGPYRQLGDVYWSHLPELLRTGEPIVKMDSAVEGEAQYVAQATALAWMLTPAAQSLARMLPMCGDEAVLDLGAGSGIWSLTLAAAQTGVRVTALDRPMVLKIAQVTAQRMGVADRLTLLPGDLSSTTFPEGQDIALLGNVTHLLSEDENRALFDKTRAALKPGRRLVVLDILPGQAEGDLNRTLYALGLALRTAHGTVHTPKVLSRLLREAGYNEPTLTALDVPPYAMGMLVATRPET